MIFTEAELAYLAEQRVGRLGTLSPAGGVQVKPVGFYHNPRLDCIDIGGSNMEHSQKYRNVAANGTVSLCVDDVITDHGWQVRFLEIRGVAEALLEPDDSAFAGGGAIIRIHPRRVISYGIDPDNPRSGKRSVPVAAH